MYYILGFLIYSAAQFLVWIQSYGPLKIEFIKNNPWIPYAISIPITHLFIVATRLIVSNSDGLTWESRFIQFAAGIITFAIMSGYYNSESINLKTGISILLVGIVVAIQIFWKN